MTTQAIPFDIVAFFGKKRERARQLRSKEVIPSELDAAFDLVGQVDHEWVWVLEVDGELKGVLVASPAHGVAMIWRIVIKPGCSTMALGRLLRRFLKDCRKRGIVGYMTVLQMEGTQEALARIMEKVGAIKVQEGMTMYAGKLPRENI